MTSHGGKGRDHLYVSAIVSVFASPAHQPHSAGELHARRDFVREHGEVPCADVVRLTHPNAVPLPADYFNGPWDRLSDYDRMHLPV